MLQSRGLPAPWVQGAVQVTENALSLPSRGNNDPVSPRPPALPFPTAPTWGMYSHDLSDNKVSVQWER